jgi:hypothetical protein
VTGDLLVIEAVSDRLHRRHCGIGERDRTDPAVGEQAKTLASFRSCSDSVSSRSASDREAASAVLAGQGVERELANRAPVARRGAAAAATIDPGGDMRPAEGGMLQALAHPVDGVRDRRAGGAELGVPQVTRISVE